MRGFKQFIEGLSSHGGFPFTARTGDGDSWRYGDSMVLGVAQEKQQKDLINLYKNSIKKMEEKLVKFPNHNFHIYYGSPNNELLKSISVDGFSRDVATKFKQKEALNKLFFTDMGIPKSDIVFLKAQHTGDPLTAWMTFHTLAHGLVSNVHPVSDKVVFYNLGVEVLNNLARESLKRRNSEASKFISSDGKQDIYDAFFKDDNSLANDYDKYDSQADKNRITHILNNRGEADEVFGCIYPFRSARIPRDNNDKFSRVGAVSEVTYELMASYLWNGGNIPRPKGECLQKIARFFGLSEEDTLAIIDRKFNEIESKMEKLLNSAAGKVIMD